MNNLIGTIEYSTGKITLNSLNVTSVGNTDGTIRIFTIPSSYDIIPVKQQIVTIDIANLSVTGLTDNFEKSTTSEITNRII